MTTNAELSVGANFVLDYVQELHIISVTSHNHYCNWFTVLVFTKMDQTV